MSLTKQYTRWSKRIERNILAVYNRANAEDRTYGINWYAQANQDISVMAHRHGYKSWQGIGVVAVISPGLNWGRNLIEADELMEAHRKGLPLPIVGVYGKENIAKALKILNGADPLEVFPVATSPKVRAFFACMLDPWGSSEVVIDRHAKGLAYMLTSSRTGSATNNKLSMVRPAEFKYLAWHYKKLAKRLGLLPHQLQAITWVTWKRLEGEIEKQEIPF